VHWFPKLASFRLSNRPFYFKQEQEMASGKVPSSGELFDLMVNGSAAQQAVEQAIQKGLQSFVETADKEINKLVQANTAGPDVAAEMLKLNKSVIDMTISMIKNGPIGPADSKTD